MGKVRDLLSYTTVKMVQIDDMCLGLLHYLFMFAILLYVVVYQVVYNTGYVAFETPVGTVRMSLQGPTMVEDGFACDPTKPGCAYNFTTVSDLPYCSQSGNPTYKGQATYECRDWDSFDVVSPVTGGSPFFITTRVTEAKQSLYCDEPSAGEPCRSTYVFGCNNTFTYDPHCPPGSWSEETFFLADVDRFTLLLDHSVRSPTVASLEADSLQMTGHMESCTGEVIQADKTPQAQDIFSVQTLLAAAQNGEKCGLTLDMASSAGAGGGKGNKRYNGMILLLTIEYSNVLPWKGVQRTISYVYRTELILGTKSKVFDEIFVDYPHTRVTRNLHGIKLVVLQTGQLGTAQAGTLLLQLTTSLALLAAATTIVDMLALYGLPHKSAYRDAKIDEVTVDATSGELIIKNPKAAEQDVHESRDEYGNYRTGLSYGTMDD